MDEENTFSFEEELYEAIAMLDVWNGGTAQATEGGVVFQVAGISAVDEFTATGMAALDIRDEEERPVEFLTIDLILAKGADQNKAPLIMQKLYEVNLGFKEGMFYMDDSGSFCFEANIPVLRESVESSLQLFIAEFLDILHYLDGVYPYLLRLIGHPEVADFAEYITTMLGEE